MTRISDNDLIALTLGMSGATSNMAGLLEMMGTDAVQFCLGKFGQRVSALRCWPRKSVSLDREFVEYRRVSRVVPAVLLRNGHALTEAVYVAALYWWAPGIAKTGAMDYGWYPVCGHPVLDEWAQGQYKPGPRYKLMPSWYDLAAFLHKLSFEDHWSIMCGPEDRE